MKSQSATEIRANGAEFPNHAMANVAVFGNVRIIAQSHAMKEKRSRHLGIGSQLNIRLFGANQGIANCFSGWEDWGVQKPAQEFLYVILYLHER